MTVQPAAGLAGPRVGPAEHRSVGEVERPDAELTAVAFPRQVESPRERGIDGCRPSPQMRLITVSQMTPAWPALMASVLNHRSIARCDLGRLISSTGYGRLHSGWASPINDRCGPEPLPVSPFRVFLKLTDPGGTPRFQVPKLQTNPVIRYS